MNKDILNLLNMFISEEEIKIIEQITDIIDKASESSPKEISDDKLKLRKLQQSYKSKKLNGKVKNFKQIRYNKRSY